MVFTYNPIPTITRDGLALMETLKRQLRTLKTDAYGSGANMYAEDRTRPDLHTSVKELYDEVGKILPPVVIKSIASERDVLKPRLETSLSRDVSRLLPNWVPDNVPVMYVSRVEGRNYQEMSDPESGLQLGHKKKQTPIAVLTAGEFRRSYRQLLVTDTMLQNDPIKYMPPDAQYILSSVHKLYLAVKNDNHLNGNDGNGNLTLNGWRADDRVQVHFRNKSGPELLWKVATYLTGLEEDEKGPRGDILDEAGARLIIEDKDEVINTDGVSVRLGGYEERSIAIHQHFTSRHRKIDWTQSVRLQALHTGTSHDNGAEQKRLFLRQLPFNLRGFYERVIVPENRSSIKLKGTVPPYYLEILAPLDMEGDGVNILNILTYPRSVFKSMYSEHGHDPFAYKARDEGWRTDHWTLMEWVVALKLAGTFMDENGLKYVRDLAQLRLRDGRLLTKKASRELVKSI